ncbi:MAG: HD domain-containing phosphohydrolase [Pseudomonadota bacterium]
MASNFDHMTDSLQRREEERKQGEKTLQESEEKYRTHFENVSDVIFSFDRELKVLSISPSLERILGYKAEESVGKSIKKLNILSPEYLEEALYDGMRALAGENVDLKTYELIARDRTKKYMEFGIVPLIRDGQIVAAVSVARDVTERRLSEEGLRESEEQYRSLVENIDFGVTMIDKDFKIIMTNSVLSRWFNKPIPEFVGKNCFTEFEKRQAICEYCPGVKTMATGQTHQVETRGVRDDGSHFSVLVHTFPLFNPDGTVKRFIEVIEDITDRKLSEEQLKRRLDRLEALRAIDMAITASLDIRVTFSVFLEQVINTLAVDAADILLLNSQIYNRLKYIAGRGFRTSALKYTDLPLGAGYAGKVAQERKTICIPDLQKESENFLKQSPQLSSENFVTYYGTPLIAKGEVRGVLEVFNRTPLEPEQEWIDFLEALATQAAIAVDNAQLFNSLQKSNIDLLHAYDDTLEGWSKALDLRDKETEGHSQRVTDMTLRLAGQMGIRNSELVHVRRGALLHDIGKMGIPDPILLKPGALNNEEWEIMHKHPVYACELLTPISYLRPALDIPYCHHEKWDGTGYPRGIKGEQIPLAARIFAVVDVWDALCSERPYRPAWPEEKVREHIKEQNGKHFDPKVVEAFLELLKNLNQSDLIS